ncbi:MAG: DUF4388 domain-containing protein [Myxococcota bacterium]
MSGVIMAGALGEFDVPSILQAVSLSRQCTLLRLWDHDARETGEIRVKAGQLLGASCGDRRGRAALHSLLRAEHHSFQVERFADPVNLPQPLGPLATMLLDMPQPVPDPPPLRAPVEHEPAPSTVETVNAPMPDSAADRLDELVAIRRVLVCRVADGRHCWEWSRDAGRPSSVDLHALVVALLESELSAGTATFELPGETVVARRLGAGAIAAYGFEATAPLGLVRFVSNAAHRIAAGHSQTEVAS